MKSLAWSNRCENLAPTVPTVPADQQQQQQQPCMDFPWPSSFPRKGKTKFPLRTVLIPTDHPQASVREGPSSRQRHNSNLGITHHTRGCLGSFQPALAHFQLAAQTLNLGLFRGEFPELLPGLLAGQGYRRRVLCAIRSFGRPRVPAPAGTHRPPGVCRRPGTGPTIQSFAWG